MSSDWAARSLELHRRLQGKLAIQSLVPLRSRDDLSLAYTPGVAEPCRAIAQDPTLAYDLTWRGRTVAVISDGSAVLGLGNIGPEASLPVMEGKALLLKEMGGVDAVPIVIKTQETSEIIRFVEQIAPSFAGVNLEDIAAPRCFAIEEALQDIGIPVFHDDQHGTAIVVTAALQNAARVVGKKYSELRVVIVGAGAAGMAVSRMLLGVRCVGASCGLVPHAERVGDLIMVDSVGAINRERTDLNLYKEAIAVFSNKENRSGDLAAMLRGADAVIGVAGPNLISPAMVKTMAPRAIVFSLANPTPEIMPEEAKAAGAMVVATGRSDYPNQINNVLAFPGVFRAVIQGRLKKISSGMKQAAAQRLAELVPEPDTEHIIPDPFMPNLAEEIAQAILRQAKEEHAASVGM